MNKHPSTSKEEPYFGDFIVVNTVDNSLRFEIVLETNDKTDEEQEALGALFTDLNAEWRSQGSNDPSVLLEDVCKMTNAESAMMKLMITEKVAIFCSMRSLDFGKIMPVFIDGYGQILQFRHKVLGIDWAPNVYFEEEVYPDA